MSKHTFFDIVNLLKPHLQKQNTQHKMAIAMEVCVVFIIYKYVQGVDLLVCHKLFIFINPQYLWWFVKSMLILALCFETSFTNQVMKKSKM